MSRIAASLLIVAAVLALGTLFPQMAPAAEPAAHALLTRTVSRG